MENATLIALSRQMALRREMDVIANNIANMDTQGYKRQRVLFQQYLVDTPVGEDLSFVWDYAVARDTSPGRLVTTGNPLDLAITGDGYLVVETADGERYSKSGRLQVNPEGLLVGTTGDPVLDIRGAPIALDAIDGQLTIAADGTISTELGPIAQLDIVAFDNEQNLRPIGDGLYITDDPTVAPTNAKLIQGMLEQSNVQPILEMTNMIRVLRSYQGTQKLMDSEHELQRRMIDRIGRVR